MSSFFFKKKEISLKFILNFLNLKSSKIVKDIKIKNISNLKEAKKDEITFLNKSQYINDAKLTKASVCIVTDNLSSHLNKNIVKIISDKPLIDFYRIALLFYPDSDKDDEIVKNSYKNNNYKKNKIIIGNNGLIDKSVKIGQHTKIGNNVIINSNVKIGRNCNIGSNVVIHNAFIGDNVIIKSGSLIGLIGFGFTYVNKKKIVFPHIGRVIIESNVQIGSLCTIDRGSLSDTVIGEFTSVDNQVQIAHNVKIGNFCLIAAQCGIAGSTIIGNNVSIGGQSGISGHLRIGNNVKIGGKSGVIKNIKDNETVMGYPAKNIKEFIKNKNEKN